MTHTERLVELRCRLYEQQQMREAAERRAREAALQENKGDVTAKQPVPPAPSLKKETITPLIVKRI